jgi:hypothetical protein
MGTCQLREKTLTPKHRSSSVAWSWCSIDNPTKENGLSRNLKEGQGPYRAVESMMIMTMMMMTFKKTYSLQVLVQFFRSSLKGR